MIFTRLTFADPVQARYEVIVADYREAQERVDSGQNVYYKSAVFPGFRTHQGPRKLLYGRR